MQRQVDLFKDSQGNREKNTVSKQFLPDCKWYSVEPRRPKAVQKIVFNLV